MTSYTWGGCFNNPMNKTLERQNSNTQHDNNHGHGHFYSTRGQGRGQGPKHHFYNTPLLSNPFPILFIEQASTNTPPDALSTVANTNNASMGNNQSYVIKHIQKSNRGEKNIHHLNDNVINCESIYIKGISCCNTTNDAVNTARLALPYTNSCSHHINLFIFQHSQDENNTRHLLNKHNNIYIFDTECIQGVDNFKLKKLFIQHKLNV